MEIKSVTIEKPDDVNIILGQSHFIKTVEDLYEVMVSSVPKCRFGIAFCEASGKCLVRWTGNDGEMIEVARENASRVGCGHSFLIAMRDAYPLNFLNAVKSVNVVCSIFCATANKVDVIIAENERGRGILGVIDGERPKGIEGESDRSWRIDLLRNIGYKQS